jgi:hypothetical protein
VAEKLSILIDLKGAEEITRQLDDIGEAGQKAFADITKAAEEAGGFSKLDPEKVTKGLESLGDVGAESIKKIQTAVSQLSFEEATRSIAALGATSKEALEGAAAAAQKFGASQQQFQSIEGIIKSLAARSRDSSISFKDLAQNYDKARSSVVATGAALATAGQSLSQLSTSGRTAGEGARAVGEGAIVASRGVGVMAQAMGDLRVAMIATRPAATELGVSLGALGTLFRAAGRAGPIGLLIGGLLALQVAFEKAADKARVLQQRLSDTLRSQEGGARIFQQLEDVSQRTGASVDDLTASYQKLANAIQITQRVGPIRFVPGFEPGRRALAGIAEFLEVFENIGKAAGESQKKTSDAINTLIDDFSKVTKQGDAFRKLRLEMPAFANAIFDAFKRPGETIDDFIKRLDRLPISLEHLVLSASKIKASTANAGEGLRTIDQAANDLRNSWNNLMATFGKAEGIALAVFTLDKLTASLKTVTEWINKPETRPAWLQGLIDGSVAVIAKLEELQKKLNEVSDPQQQQLRRPAFLLLLETLGLIEKTAEDAGDALGKLDTIPLPRPRPTEEINKDLEGTKTKASDAASALQNIAPAAAKAAESTGNLRESLAQISSRLLGAQFKQAAESAFDPFTRQFAPTGPEDPFSSVFHSQAVMDAAARRRAAELEADKPVEVIKNPFVQLQNSVEPLKTSMSDLQIAIDPVTTAFSNMATSTEPINTALSGLGTSLEPLNTAFADLGTSVEPLNAAFADLDSSLEPLNASFSDLADSVQPLDQAFEQLASSAEDAASNGGGGSFEAFEAARGGLIGGRGSGTSDSNLAWISRGEHIMPARAVQQPGVLAFLEALRRSGGNLERVLNQMGHFAFGGLIMPRMIPTFASGGLAGAATNNVTIQFPGLPPISNLKASSDTIEELRRAAAMAQVRSGGRKPSRYS